MIPYTKQTAFDTSARHLLTQNKKAKLSAIACAYRGEDGTKCGIGCLIPDDRYLPSMEGKTVMDLMLWGKVNDLFEDPDHNIMFFLTDLQHVHDGSPVADWKAKLAEFGFLKGLDVSVLNEFP